MNRRVRSASTGKMIATFVVLLALSPVFAHLGQTEEPPSPWCDDPGVTATTVGC